MDGRGVMQRTEELTDAMWKGLLVAWPGMILVVIAAVSWCAAALHHFPWEPAPTFRFQLVTGALAVTGIAVGVALMVPWFKAVAALNRHTAAMKAETAKRGKGWADS